MQRIEGTTIKLNRGDVLNLKLSVKNKDGSTYIFHSQDKVVFAVYSANGLNKPAKLIKEVIVPADSEYVEIALTSQETKLGELGNKAVEYWYEIELNEQFTIIGYDDQGAKILKLFPEGSRQDDTE